VIDRVQESFTRPVPSKTFSGKECWVGAGLNRASEEAAWEAIHAFQKTRGVLPDPKLARPVRGSRVRLDGEYGILVDFGWTEDGELEADVITPTKVFHVYQPDIQHGFTSDSCRLLRPGFLHWGKHTNTAGRRDWFDAVNVLFHAGTEWEPGPGTRCMVWTEQDDRKRETIESGALAWRGGYSVGTTGEKHLIVTPKGDVHYLASADIAYTEPCSLADVGAMGRKLSRRIGRGRSSHWQGYEQLWIGVCANLFLQVGV
jgi:hypothetical protein